MTAQCAMPHSNPRQDRGRVAHHFGKSAEAQVERHYERGGAQILHRRWRSSSGEIDLIVQDRDVLVFVEVKASSSMERAMQSLRPAQIRRISRAAEEYLQHVPTGALTDVRFDLACCDRTGHTQVFENAFGHF